VVNAPLPIILGSDLAGVVESTGNGVTTFKRGDQSYGLTNDQFIGTYAEFAVGSAKMVAPKPRSLNFVESASVPVVAVTAWQMLFDYAQVRAGQGSAHPRRRGNVGVYAVQLVRQAGLHVTATASPKDIDYVRGLGADKIVNYQMEKFEEAFSPVDVVIDTVADETQERSFAVLKPGGILVSVVSPFPKTPQHPGVRTAFFLVEVTTARLEEITRRFDQGKLKTQVGTVLPLVEARRAHEMLGGSPHARGQIVLKIE
jgi:NADPH:quinone reductase-like Zn-dependent oxidoreductase